MIKVLEGLPENVLGIIVTGRVTKSDCTDILLPALEKCSLWHYNLRLYYQIRARYPGACWEIPRWGIEQGWRWERIAIVTDTAALRHAVNAIGFLIPGELRVFNEDQVPDGLAWITAPQQLQAGRWVSQRAQKPSAAPGASITGTARSWRLPPQYMHDPLP